MELAKEWDAAARVLARARGGAANGGAGGGARPARGLLGDYGRYLLVERRLSEHTVRYVYAPAVRLFLAGREGPDRLALERLSAADVSTFLAREWGSAM